MRLFLVISVAAFLAANQAPAAHAGVAEEHVLSLLAKEASRQKPLARLRKNAKRGKTDAQLGLYLHYRLMARGVAGHSVSNERLVSRAEAEHGLFAAADKEDGLAMLVLGAARLYGLSVLRHREQAENWLSQAVDSAPSQWRPLARLLLAEARGADEAVLDDLPAEFSDEVVALRAELSDSRTARADLEAALDRNPGIVDVALARRLITGDGAVAEPQRALVLFDAAIKARSARAAAEVGRLYVEGTHVLRRPRFGIALMSGWAEVDTTLRLELAALLHRYPVTLDNARTLMLRMAEDAEVGEPGAALALVRLIEARREGFRDEKLLFELLKQHWTREPQIALIRASYLGRWSTKNNSASKILARNARKIIDTEISRGTPGAWSKKANMLSKGLGYEQDHLAATAAYQKGVEAGEVDSYLGLAEAYRSGIGVPKDSAAELELLRHAAAQGSVDARVRLMWLYKFDFAHKRMSLAEGVTDPVVLYGDGLGSVAARDVGALFRNQRLRDFPSKDVIAAFMSGLRAAPEAVIGNRLQWLQSSVPRQAWAEVEKVLQSGGFYKGEITGLLGPAARKSLLQWVTQVRS